MAVSELTERIGAKPATASSNFKFYLFGDTGVGKTHFISTAADVPELGKLLVIDTENGTETFRHRHDIDVVQVRTVGDMTKLHKELRDDNGATYGTVAIDSLTELQQLDIQEIMVIANRTNPNQNIDVPSQREWGMTYSHMRKIVRAYKDLPYNLIVTALATQAQNPSTGETVTWPALQGQAMVKIPAYFGLVAYYFTVMEKDNVERRLLVDTMPKYKVKDRYHLGGPVIVNPDMAEMYRRYEAGAKLSKTTKDQNGTA